MKNLIIIDVETSGLDPVKNDIIQLGAVKLNNNYDITERFSIETKPINKNNWDKKAEKVHKISLKHLMSVAFSLKTALDFFDEWVGNPKKYLLGGWNVCFDAAFLLESYKKINKKFLFDYHFIDVNSLVYFSQGKILKLNEAKKVFKINNYNIHDAMNDCISTALILKRIKNGI